MVRKEVSVAVWDWWGQAYAHVKQILCGKQKESLISFTLFLAYKALTQDFPHSPHAKVTLIFIQKKAQGLFLFFFISTTLMFLWFPESTSAPS